MRDEREKVKDEVREQFDYLPVCLIAEVVYCPRNFYYRFVEQWDDVVSAEMIRGKLEDEKRKTRKTVMRETGRQVRSVMVSSKRLGLIAVVDALEEIRQFANKTASSGDSTAPQSSHDTRDDLEPKNLPLMRPIEYKTGGLPPDEPAAERFPEFGVRPEWVQVCAEAMILEEMIEQPIDRGYVYYTASRTRKEIVFTGELREKVKEAIALAWNVLDEGIVPDPVADERCEGCSFFAMCQPHEVKFLEGKGPAPPQRIIPQDILARTLYVDEQGASVRKRGGQIVVEKWMETEKTNQRAGRQAHSGEKGKKRVSGKRMKLLAMPAVSVDQLVLAGNVQVSTQTIKFLLRSNVEIVYLSTHGRFEGRFVPEYHKNVHLRLRQYALPNDEAQCLALSRQFVFGKLSNMRTLLLRYGRNLDDEILMDAAREVERMLRQIDRTEEMPMLLGLEGQGSRAYFKVFGRLIRRRDLGFDFERRTRRPPRDPVNALLGFAYALLLADVIAGCSAAGLDPYIGFFHRARYGRPALALDLMEEFRPIVADSVVLTLINKGMVEQRHFEEKMGGVFLNEAGREVFYSAYSQRKHEQITHPVFQYKLPYHRIFELQARFLAKVVTGDLIKYVPFAVR